MIMKKLLAAFAGTILLSTLAPAALAADSYPAKPVRLVVGYSPGGPFDVIARVLGEKLSNMWGQPVTVDNRVGAGGNIASEAVARAPADGYTLLLAANSHVFNGSLYNNLPYDPIKDFTPISQVMYYPLVLVVNPNLPMKSLKDFVDYAKAHPGKVMFGSAGNGTPTHLAGELFKRVAGIDIVHVPYKGAGPATNDVLGGHIEAIFNNPVSALPMVKSGQLRALATTGLQRLPNAPDAPTVAESGYPGFEAGTWGAVMGPAGLPPGIVAKIETDLLKVLSMPDVRKRIEGLGVQPTGTTAQQLSQIMHTDHDKWDKVIRAADIRLD
ncbi:Tripartite tricarboxylate transporter family receptor [Pigmentiphaga humi]|uniref:Tripartite tricarboxylate transporter family receptor n=1 Tax=Pigmentiphaga humi TaxID=2478468 RepID=A0A3P4B3J2_9BURK|nr:tripartite tricarboxylate transporter substrate binding protein [Pigmentiphaga humi]VCU69715.1 Tripartite tricarboxylate transporter family receptor [Pigmentiphaga humi]